MNVRKVLLFVIPAFAVVAVIIFYFKSNGILFGNNYKGTIVPVTQWKGILPGNWGFAYEEKTEDHDYLHKGEIELSKDSTFKLYINIKDLKRQMYGELSAGGDIEGNFSFENDSTFVLIANKTNISVSRTGGGSLSYIEENLNKFYNSLSFGRGYFEGQKLDIQQFNPNKIVFVGKRLDNDADIHYIFSKDTK